MFVICKINLNIQDLKKQFWPKKKNLMHKLFTDTIQKGTKECIFLNDK